MRKSLMIAILGVFPFYSALDAKAQEETKAVREARLLSQAFTEVADEAMPATVSIKVHLTRNLPDTPFDLFRDEFFHRFFGQPFEQQKLAGGSGFLISQDGYIVTNHHVVKNSTEITVRLNDGREYPAVVKGIDLKTELAVIKIEEKDLPHLSFGDSDGLKVGEWVVAIGNPVGLEGTLTAGVVSAKGRQDIGVAAHEDFIQTDTAINPGNSGGPLLNLDGDVVGVNTAIYTNTGGYMGIGFAIPSKIVQRVVSQIIDNGTVQRGYLGVVLQQIDKDLAEALELEKQEGVLITDVVKGSPAEKAGLKVGDIILESNEKFVRNVNALRNEIALMNPQAELNLLILRNHKQISCTAKLGSQSDSALAASEILQKVGLEVGNLTPELGIRLGQTPEVEGVVISNVLPGSPAAIMGLRSGAIITAVAADWNTPKAVRNTAELEDALRELKDKKRLILIVRYQNLSRYYTFKVNP